jgi:hypothetical protein
MFENVKELLAAAPAPGARPTATAYTVTDCSTRVVNGGCGTAVAVDGSGDVFHRVHRAGPELAANGRYHTRALESLHEMQVVSREHAGATL